MCPEFLDRAGCSVFCLLLSSSILQTLWPLRVTVYIWHLASGLTPGWRWAGKELGGVGVGVLNSKIPLSWRHWENHFFGFWRCRFPPRALNELSWPSSPRKAASCPSGFHQLRPALVQRAGPQGIWPVCRPRRPPAGADEHTKGILVMRGLGCGWGPAGWKECDVGTQRALRCWTQACKGLDSFQKANKVPQLSAVFYFVCWRHAFPAWAGDWAVVETPASTPDFPWSVDSAFLSAHWSWEIKSGWFPSLQEKPKGSPADGRAPDLKAHSLTPPRLTDVKYKFPSFA